MVYSSQITTFTTDIDDSDFYTELANITIYKSLLLLNECKQTTYASSDSFIQSTDVETTDSSSSSGNSHDFNQEIQIYVIFFQSLLARGFGSLFFLPFLL